MISRRSVFLTPLALLATRVGSAAPGNLAAPGKMSLCIHTNTSSAAGYRGALEGWAKAGIKNIELNAALVDDFLKTDTIDAARRVLTDNGLSLVHGAVGTGGLFEPSPNHAAAMDGLKKRFDLFASLGLTHVYTTSSSMQKLTLDDYKVVVDNIRDVGEAAKQAGMRVAIEFGRWSSYMSTLTTALKYIREAGHPNVGPMLDFYHFWSWLGKSEDLDLIKPGELFHVHFQDVPDMPRELLDTNTRIIPGDGVSPIVPMLKKLAEKGYAGPLSVELFLPKFRDGNPYDVAREIRQKCEPLMTQAGVL